MLWILIFDILLLVVQRIDWLMILTEINKVALQCKNKLPFPAQCKSKLPYPAVQILLKSLEQCNYDATRFSWPHRPAVLYDFLCWLLFCRLRWIKSRLGDSNYTYEKHLSVVESAFTFSFSPIPQLSQYHRPSERSNSSKSLQCKNAPISSSQVRSRR